MYFWWRIYKLFRIGAYAFAAATFAMLCLAFTPLPGRAYHALGRDAYRLKEPPEYIFVLGGGGIPSASGLMRTYRAAQLHPAFPKAAYIVSLPAEGDPNLQSVGRMRDELVMRGVPAGQILMETRARNTHEQAENIKALLPRPPGQVRCMLVTSGYHLKRSLLTFRKSGYTQLAGTRTGTLSAEADMGPLTALRYDLWRSLSYELEVTREWIAIAYYKLRGWV